MTGSRRPRRTRFIRGWRRAWLVTVLAMLAAATPASVLAARSWTITAVPDTLVIDITTAIDLTVTNTGHSGNGITCVRIQVPSDFEIEGVSVKSIRGQSSGASYQAWTAVGPNGNVVAFKNPPETVPLEEDDRAVFQITGHAHTPGAWSWTADAADKPGSQNSVGCGSGGGDYPDKTISFLVVGTATPTPTPPPTPAPTPKPTPTPALTPTPTPKPTPAPTPGPTVKPETTPRPTARPTSPPGTTPAPTAGVGSSASPGLTPGPSSSPSTTAEASAAASGAPGLSSPEPSPTAEPGSGGSGGGTGGGGFQIGGGGSGGTSAISPASLDGTVLEALNGLPGGMLAWAYPTFVLAIPGLLLLLAVGAQAFGALAWLPLVRRRLGDFGFERRKPGA